MRLEGLTRLAALKYYQQNTGSRAKILPNEHNAFSQCMRYLYLFNAKYNQQRPLENTTPKNLNLETI